MENFSNALAFVGGLFAMAMLDWFKRWLNHKYPEGGRDEERQGTDYARKED